MPAHNPFIAPLDLRDDKHLRVGNEPFRPADMVAQYAGHETARVTQQNAARCNSVIIVEAKGSGMSVAQDLKRDSINIISYKPEGSKEQRASIAFPQIEAGNVLLPFQALWLPDFKAECMAFTL